MGPSLTLSALERISRASYATLFLAWVFVHLLFTAAYFALALWAPAHAPSIAPDLSIMGKALQCLYFSIITATTTGFGDISPHGFSQALAAVQSVFGVLLSGLFVAKLVSHSGEVALSDVHRLTFESIFHHVRRGLFQVRKDFDTLIREVRQHQTLQDHEWENVTTAYLQAQSFIEEIPDFYRNESAYTIDPKREALLIDSVQRTLERLVRFLEALEQHRVGWRHHRPSLDQLLVLGTIIDATILVWERFSPNHTLEHFAGILAQQQRLHDLLLPHQEQEEERVA